MNRFDNPRNLTLLLVLLALSTIIDGLDASIVNVALPTLSKEMEVSLGDTSWVTLTYIISIAALLLPAARLAKNGTVKRMFIVGVAVFTVSSMLCGISNDFYMLVMCRLVQGIGAALMTAAVPVMIMNFVPHNKKGLGMGVLAVASGVAIVLGPSIGGIITSMLSWHWVFHMNLPFGILTILLAMYILPKDEGYERSNNPDMVNSILIMIGVGAGFVFIHNLVCSDIPDELVLLCGIVTLTCLIALVHRSRSKPDTALIASDMLRRNDFRLLTLAFTMTCMIISGVQYVLPYQLQIIGEHSAHMSGLLLSISSIFAILISVPVGKWCDSRGCKVPSVLAGVGRLSFCIIFLLSSPKDEMILFVIGLAVMGCSMAFAGTGLATALIHHSNVEHQGDATTFLLEVNYMAASMGIVLFSLIFQTIVGDIHVGFASSASVDSAFRTTMVVGALLSVVAIVCASVVKNIVPEKEK